MAAREPHALILSIAGPISWCDLPELSVRVCAVLERSGAQLVLCDIRGVEPDAVTVEALARLQLAARRHRCRVRLVQASPALLDLAAYMGLGDVLPERRATTRAAAAVRTAETDVRSPGRR